MPLIDKEQLESWCWIAMLVATYYLIRRRVELKQWDGVPVPRAWFPEEK